jgi:hypothetical protein
MSKQTVKAFTILEITITMMISAILIGLTFTIYTIVSHSYRSFSDKNDDVLVMLTLDKLLKRDFLKAESVLRKGSAILIIGRTDTALYDFKPGYLVRTRGITDTFRVNYQQLDSRFEGVSSNPSADSTVLQDELSFRIDYKDQAVPYHYFKHYSSETLLHNDPYAIH